MPPESSGEARGQWESWRRLLGGLLYLFFVTCIFSGITGTPFLPVFLAVLCGTVFCIVVGLIWLTNSALNKEARRWQFGIGSMLMTTLFASIYFSVVRWLVVNQWRPSYVKGDAGLGQFLGFGVLCFILAALGIPFLILLADRLVWFAVWLVKRPLVRRWLANRRTGREEE